MHDITSLLLRHFYVVSPDINIKGFYIAVSVTQVYSLSSCTLSSDFKSPMLDVGVPLNAKFWPTG